MFSTKRSLFIAVLSAAALLVSAGAVSAQHGHGGWGHGGHGGWGHGGWGHGHVTGLGHYLHDHAGYGYGHHHHYPYGYSYSYPSIYSGYSYYSPTLYSGSYYATPVYSSVPNYGTPAVGLPVQPAAPVGNVARVEVVVPSADAQVWVEGVEMASRGTNRVLESPELAPGRSYTYTIRASWNQGNQTVGDERKVDVVPGQTFSVDFTRAAPRGNAERMPAPKQ